ncbi:MAG: vWA domain-containing protein [Myxococcota bacterium]|nr:vWA domain-containing protein [Myxococcota bacterium]
MLIGLSCGDGRLYPFDEVTTDTDTEDIEVDTDSEDIEVDTNTEEIEIDTDTADTDTSTSSDELCPAWDMRLDVLLPRLMLLQDLSFSMNSNASSNWHQAKQAIKATLEKYKKQIAFGFDGFPNATNCVVSRPPYLDCDPQNAQIIIDEIDSLDLFRSTPLYLGLKNFTKTGYAPNCTAQDRRRYLLLISDGADSCGAGGPIDPHGASAEELAEVTSSVLESTGTATFVIGYGSGVNPYQLNAIAAAGGTEFDEYIAAQHQFEFEHALDIVYAAVADCVYHIDNLSNDPIVMDEVNFFFDGDLVGWDDNCAHNTGWTWAEGDTSRVEFCHAACMQLKAGNVDEITAELDCPTISIP